LLAFVVALSLFAANVAQAGPIVLAAGSTWEYTFTDPTGSALWNTTTGGWATGLAPFGNNTGGYGSDPGYFDYKTYWAADATATMGDDLWVRTSVDLTGYDLNTVDWFLGVDNGFKLYANGNLIQQDNAEGYTYRWEYGGSIASAFLNPGVNVIAVALEDHGGLTAFDMQVTATAVPDGGATLMLLGGALVGLGALRRKFRG
jgi:hypothetical protein